MWGFTTVEVCVLSVSTALARLRDGLSEPFPDSPGTRIIDIAFPLNDAFDPLLWCGQQPQWPQFYWQQRNGDEELAALGEGGLCLNCDVCTYPACGFGKGW